MAKKLNEYNDIIENVDEKSFSKAIPEKYKTERCKVLAYNRNTKELDINFRGYGIRINNVNEIKSNFILVKYQGEIGKPNFSCKL